MMLALPYGLALFTCFDPAATLEDTAKATATSSLPVAASEQKKLKTMLNRLLSSTRGWWLELVEFSAERELLGQSIRQQFALLETV